MKLIMFDIDGTLTESTAVDGEAFLQALRDVFGFSAVSNDWTTYPDVTDVGIVNELFRRHCGRCPLPLGG